MFIEGVFLGGEEGGAATRDQLEILLAPGERIAFATAGESGGALFTDRRLLVSSNAGLFTKRSVVHSIDRDEIGAFKIDVDGFTQLFIYGSSFGEARFFFDIDLDKIKLARWLAQGSHIDANTES